VVVHAFNPGTLEAHPGLQNKCKASLGYRKKYFFMSQKKKKKKTISGSGVEQMLSMCKALGSIPSSRKRKKSLKNCDSILSFRKYLFSCAHSLSVFYYYFLIFANLIVRNNLILFWI
jgi:hypothetical protein